MGLATAKILGRDHRFVIADVDQQRVDAAVAEIGGLGVDVDAAVCAITDRTSVDALMARANESEDQRHGVQANSLAAITV
jgi:NAD(P)-dependent dehydrogenase (short-subunit alcohol dehydrogenase family)